VINGILYGVNPQMKLFAINAETGKQQWVFDPNSKTPFDGDLTSFHIKINCRGLVIGRMVKMTNAFFMQPDQTLML